MYSAGIRWFLEVIMDKPMEIDFVGGGSRTQPLHGRQTHVTGAHLSRGVQYAWAAYADVINRIASSTELYGLNGDTRYSPMPRAERSSSRAQYRLRVGGDKVGTKKEIPGNDLLSHPVARAVPSALASLTAVFGMGTGVSPPLSSPDLDCHIGRRATGPPAAPPERGRSPRPGGAPANGVAEMVKPSTD